MPRPGVFSALTMSARTVRGTVLFLYLLAGLGWTALRVAAADTTRDFNLPSERGEAALRLFAHQSGQDVISLTELIEDVRTSAVHGRYTPLDALQLILVGTSLHATEDRETGVLAIVRDSPDLAPQPAGTGAPLTSKPNYHKPLKPSRSLITAIGALIAGSISNAQSTSAAANTSVNEASESPILLSPFEVKESTRGYYSANTTSGTRISAKIEDLGSSITVISSQQMEDFADVNLNDVFRYEASTEGTANYTDFSFDRNGAPVDNTMTSPQTANRVRGVSAANVTFGTFRTSGQTPIDPLQVDAVEISRGPNSSLFGIGSPGGTVNSVMASANLQRDKTTLTSRVDNVSGSRHTVDFNRVLKAGVLAVRGNLVYERDGYDLKPSGTTSVRYDGMIKYRPFRYTTVTGSFISDRLYGNLPNTTTPLEAITTWQNAGSPTWNPMTNSATTGSATTPGLVSGLKKGLFTTNYSTAYVDNADGISYIGAGQTTTNQLPYANNGKYYLVQSNNDPTGFLAAQPLFAQFSPVSSKAVYDWSSVNLASPNYTDDHARIANLLVDQTLFANDLHQLTVQVGWFREYNRLYNHNLIMQPANVAAPEFLQIDVNQTRLDGSPNPDFLRPFINAAAPWANLKTVDNNAYRAQAAYKLDLTTGKNILRWLGLHELSAYAEYDNGKSYSSNYTDAIISPEPWLPAGTPIGTAVGNNKPVNAFATPQYLFYVGGKGQNVAYAPPSYQRGASTLSFVDDKAGPFTEPVTIGEAVANNSGGSQNLWSVQKSQGAILHSHFLNDHVVTTLGVRYDQLYSRFGGTPALNPDGYTLNETSFYQWAGGDWSVAKGRTTTAGVVGKLLPWVSVYASKSNSFQPAPPAQNAQFQLLSNPTGAGEDTGFTFTFFGGKLNARVNFYTTDQLSSRNSSIATISTRMLNVDRGGIPGQNGAPAAYQLQQKATKWVTDAAAAAGQTLSQGETTSRVAAIMHVPVSFLDPINVPFASTADVTAKGKEIEINYAPTAYWTMKANITEQQAFQKNVGAADRDWLAQRLAVWQNIIDPSTGANWFTTPYNGGLSASAFIASKVQAPLALATATEGTSQPQVRKYRVNLLTSLKLSGLTDQTILKHMTIGGALRWEDKGAIGYAGLQQLPAVITGYDPAAPIYDGSHTYVDLFTSYRTHLFGNRVPATFQLNVRSLGETGRLQPIAANPDGSISAYRIVSPQQLILSVKLEF